MTKTALQKKPGAPRQTGSGGVLGRIVLVCAAITAGAGALILVGWAIGSDALTAMGTGYSAAPNTALLFALLGSAVLVREIWPASRVIHRVATAAAVFSAVVGSVTLIGLVIGLNIDDWLFRTTRMLGDVPMGRMSPVTAFCFVLAGVSLLLLEFEVGAWAAILGTLITLVGAVCLMGYGFRAPLLYGGSAIPVALPTSVALVVLGIGLTAAAGPHTWPLNSLIGPSTRARLLRALLPTVVLLALIEDWLSAVLLEHSDPDVVLASAMTAVSFLLVVGFVIFRVSRAIGDAIDRTAAELTHAAEALRASEAQFRTLAEEDLAGVVIIQDGQFKYVNPAIARMLGYSREELLGASTVLEFVAEEDRALVEENLRRRQDGEEQSLCYIFRVRKKDGFPAYLEVFGSRIPFEGRFAVMSTVLDITDRKQAEETQAKLAAIVESSNDAIIGRALDGTVTSWNAAAERVLGYTAAETIGRDPVEIFPPLLQQQIAENRKRIRAGQMVPGHETVRIAKDGRHIDFSVSLSAIKDNSGRIIGAATTLHDITERKRTERALHNNTKQLRGLSRRLFTAVETERRSINRELHDRIGQTLAALNINLNIIRSLLPQQSLDAVSARFQDTQTLLEETAAQVRNIMADLHPPALDDYGLLAALRVYAESFGARHAEPTTVHGEDLAPRLPLAAETALFRVAQEALANAAAHARATRVQILLAATPDRVTLTIADDGIGFDAEYAALAHPSWGLATMRERAEAVGAALRIDTAPGRGTRVVVEIEREAA